MKPAIFIFYRPISLQPTGGDRMLISHLRIYSFHYKWENASNLHQRQVSKQLTGYTRNVRLLTIQKGWILIIPICSMEELRGNLKHCLLLYPQSLVVFARSRVYLTTFRNLELLWSRIYSVAPTFHCKLLYWRAMVCDLNIPGATPILAVIWIICVVV